MTEEKQKNKEKNNEFKEPHSTEKLKKKKRLNKQQIEDSL